MPVLLVADLLHPIDHLAVNALLDRDVSHGRSGCGSMPMLLARREPHDIAGPDLLDRSTFALSPAAARCDNQSLTQRMRVPCRPRTRFESHAGTADVCRIRCLKQRINSHR